MSWWNPASWDLGGGVTFGDTFRNMSWQDIPAWVPGVGDIGDPSTVKRKDRFGRSPGDPNYGADKPNVALFGAGAVGSGGAGPLGLPNYSIPEIKTMLASPSGISQEYLSMLNTATQAQTAPIQAMYQAGIAELMRRQGESDSLLKILPGNIKDIGNENEGALMDLSKLFGGQADAMAPASLAAIGMSPQVGLAPAMGAMQAIEQSRLSDVPYLKVAGRQFFGGQQTAMDLARQQALAEVQAQRQQGLMQLALARMQEAGELSRFNAGQQNQAAQTWAQLNAQLQGQKLGFLGSQNEQNQALSQTYGSYAVDPNRGYQLATQNPDRANSIVQHHVKGWQNANDVIEKAVTANPPTDPSLALQQWVMSGPDNERAIRAELASLAMYQYAG